MTTSSQEKPTLRDAIERLLSRANYEGWTHRRTATAIEREAAFSANEWKRKYEGMIKERDDQIHRKRETRRILTERGASNVTD